MDGRRFLAISTLIVGAVLATTGVSAAGASESATVGQVAPSALTAPGPVTSLRATAGDKSARLTWKRPVDVGSRPLQGFIIQRRRIDGSWATVERVAATERNFVVGALPNGTRQRFRVAAYSAAGTGGWAVRSVVLPSMLSISAGGTFNSPLMRSHACGVTPARTVVCWGRNDLQQLGLGAGNGVASTSYPLPVKGLTGVRKVAAGGEHTCALKSDRTVWCWGSDAYGQLGNGAPTGGTSADAVQVTGLTGVKDLEAGSYHTCAVKTDGTAACWGLDSNGQLGDGPGGPAGVPTTVQATGLSQISAGGYHTCARTSAGAALCWGWNLLGQAGTGADTPASIDTPAEVQLLGSGVRSVSAGVEQSCAVKTDGTGWCWGEGTSGQLGDGTVTPEAVVPQQVIDVGDMVSISSGWDFVCGVYANGSGRCWGSDYAGTLGNGDGGNATAPNLVVVGASPIRSIAAGQSSVCALLRNGTPRCWGENSNGNLGDGTTTLRQSAVRVIGY